MWNVDYFSPHNAARLPMHGPSSTDLFLAEFPSPDTNLVVPVSGGAAVRVAGPRGGRLQVHAGAEPGQNHAAVPGQ